MKAKLIDVEEKDVYYFQGQNKEIGWCNMDALSLIGILNYYQIIELLLCSF